MRDSYASTHGIPVSDRRSRAAPATPELARRPHPVRAPRRGRPARPRRARRALHAARALARAPLRELGRAARGSRAGRVAGARQGDRPLRHLARARLLELRRADDRRRAQAPLPRPHVGRAPAARAAGADLRVDRVVGAAVAGARPRADRRRARRRPPAPTRSTSSRRCRRAAGAARCRSTRPPSREPDAASLEDSLGCDDDGFDHAESRAVLDGLCVGLPARAREVLRMRFEEDLTQAEIGERLGVSQMQVSRIIRQTIAHLHHVAEHHERLTAA